jgi:hypothetical protein
MIKIIKLGLVVMVLVLLQTVSFAQDIQLQVNPVKGSVGTSLTLSGQTVADEWVSIRSLTKDGSLVYFNAVKADAEGAFIDIFNVPNMSDGNLEIVVGNSKEVASVTVKITTKSNDNNESNSGGSGRKATKKPALVEITGGVSPEGLNIEFKDVADDAWYNKAVYYLAERGMVTGTGNGNFSPEADLTRGQFMVMVMNAYGILPDETLTNNFTDAGNTYYTGYLGEAKRLGIAVGIGNNQFAPDKSIIRQETFTLLYRTLKLKEKLPNYSTGKVLTDFKDANSIAIWAKGAMTSLVEIGIINGNEGLLDPISITTRAQMAQLLYQLLNE